MEDVFIGNQKHYKSVYSQLPPTQGSTALLHVKVLSTQLDTGLCPAVININGFFLTCPADLTLHAG